jgi:hypothetical protein
MTLQVVEWEGMDWIFLAQDRDRWRALVNAVMNLRLPLNSGTFLIKSGPALWSWLVGWLVGWLVSWEKWSFIVRIM